MNSRTKIGAAALGIAAIGVVGFAIGSAAGSGSPSISVNAAAATSPKHQSKRGVAGTVATVNGANFTVTTPGGTTTVDTNGSTTFTQTVTGSVSDAAVHDTVAIEGTRAADGSLGADTIWVSAAGSNNPMPRFHGTTNGPFVYGKVTANNGSVITVGSQKVTTTPATKVWKNGAASIHDVKVGVTVEVSGTDSNSVVQATRMNIGQLPLPRPPKGPMGGMNVGRGVAGTVASVSGANFAVTTPRGSMTVDTNGSTTFTQTVAGVVSDAAVNDVVAIQGTRAADGSLVADVIRVLPAGAEAPMPPKGRGTNGPFVFGTVTSNNGSVIMVGSQKVTTSS
jgi:hypothetical protein